MTINLHKEIISKVLSPAVNLWLHSQLDQVENLKIKITGSNRQIITGYIPHVFLSSSYPVYQGLHLGQVELTGENIKINLGQVLKGQPLRLLEPILVTGKIILQQEQLNLSLASTLLSTALTDLLISFLATAQNSRENLLRDLNVSWESVAIKSDKLIITGTVSNQEGRVISPVTLRSGLTLASPQKLLLHPLQIETLTQSISLNNYEIDLGPQVQLEALSLSEGQINCYGSLTVISET